MSLGIRSVRQISPALPNVFLQSVGCGKSRGAARCAVMCLLSIIGLCSAARLTEAGTVIRSQKNTQTTHTCGCKVADLHTSGAPDSDANTIQASKETSGFHREFRLKSNRLKETFEKRYH